MQITANVQVDGTLRLAQVTSLAGNLTNNGTVYMSFPNAVTPMDTLTITGNYTQSGSATLVMDIAGFGNGSGGCDLVTVNGTATLGGTLQVRTPPPANYGGVFTLMRYTSRSGQFGSVVPPAGGPTLAAWYDTMQPNAMGVRQVMGPP